MLAAVCSTHKTLLQAVRLTPSIPLALLGYSLFGCVLGTTSFTMLWFSKERGYNTRFAAATSGFIQVRVASPAHVPRVPQAPYYICDQHLI